MTGHDHDSTPGERVLLVSTVARFHSDFLEPLARFLREQGWSVHGAANGMSTRSWPEYEQTHDIPWSRRPQAVSAHARGMHAITRVLEQEDFEIVHVHTPIAAWLTRAAVHRFRQSTASRKPRVVYTAHGFHFFEGGGFLRNNAFRALEKTAARWTDALIALNDHDYQSARGLMSTTNGQVIQMPGAGIDLSFWDSRKVSADEADAFRSELRISPTTPLVLVVAEFTPNKRQVDVVRSLQLLPRSDVHLAFAGTGPQAGAISKEAARLGLSSRCHFLGFRNDVRTLMAAADLLVLASDREGMPMAVLEALAMRLPVVGTSTRGTADLIQAGRGVLVGRRNPVQLAAAIQELLSDNQLRLSLAAAGHSAVQSYSLDTVLRAHGSLYANLSGESPSGL